MAEVTPGWQEQMVCKSWCVCRAPWHVCSMPGGWQETGAGALGSSWCSRLAGRVSGHSSGHTPQPCGMPLCEPTGLCMLAGTSGKAAWGSASVAGPEVVCLPASLQIFGIWDVS